MKYTAAFVNMMLCAATAKDHFMGDSDELFKIKPGLCQVPGNGYIYDLSQFDQENRDKNKPANVEGKFYYKVCQPEFDSTDVDGMSIMGECHEKDAAYLKKGGECKYSFDLPEFTGD